MLKVFTENDKVIIDLSNRKRDVLLTPLSAEKLADTLEEKALVAENSLPGLFRGEQWEIKVTSFDGYVVIRFYPPFLGNPEQVPLPPGIARKLTIMLRRNAIWAGYKMRIETKKY